MDARTLRRFGERVAEAKGVCVIAPPSVLRARVRAAAKRRGEGYVDDGIPDLAPQRAEKPAWALLRGIAGIAESGTVVLAASTRAQIRLTVAPEWLGVYLRAEEIVETLEDFFARTTPGEVVFLTGPTKTADIEQTLVLGAHGPREVEVFCEVRRDVLEGDPFAAEFRPPLPE